MQSRDWIISQIAQSIQISQLHGLHVHDVWGVLNASQCNSVASWVADQTYGCHSPLMLLIISSSDSSQYSECDGSHSTRTGVGLHRQTAELHIQGRSTSDWSSCIYCL